MSTITLDLEGGAAPLDVPCGTASGGVFSPEGSWVLLYAARALLLRARSPPRSSGKSAASLAGASVPAVWHPHPPFAPGSGVPELLPPPPAPDPPPTPLPLALLVPPLLVSVVFPPALLEPVLLVVVPLVPVLLAVVPTPVLPPPLPVVSCHCRRCRWGVGADAVFAGAGLALGVGGTGAAEGPGGDEVRLDAEGLDAGRGVAEDVDEERVVAVARAGDGGGVHHAGRRGQERARREHGAGRGEPGGLDGEDVAGPHDDGVDAVERDLGPLAATARR